jgi:HEAT repeat protein
MRSFKRSVVQHLTVASLSLGAGHAGAVTLSELPLEVLGDVADTVEDPELPLDDRLRVVRLLSADARPAARVLAADSVGALYSLAPAETLSLVGRLAEDEAGEVRAAAAVALGEVLHRASPAERVEIVCEWTVAEEAGRRVAVAHALALPLPLFVTDLAIRQLATDPSVDVRRRAVLAAERHYQENRAAYREVAEILAQDEDRFVRRAARALMDR